jgi:formate hydrogenlyase transcriptional activator
MKSAIFCWNCMRTSPRSSGKAGRAPGCGHTFQADARVITATNQDMWSIVEARKFRADLYCRLNVFPMTLPPLRERGDDITLVTEHFVEKYARRLGKSIEGIADGVMETQKSRDWLSNIRELQNVIERGVIMTRGSVLSPSRRRI